MNNKVINTSVFLYDRRLDTVLWAVGIYKTISECFSRCKDLSAAMGKDDAFMIPSNKEDDAIFFDTPQISRFCFKIKIEVESKNSNREKEEGHGVKMA